MAPNAASFSEEVLLNAYVYIGDKPNHTTAADFTRNHERIVASFWSERPPLPSRLYVHCPDLNPSAFSQLPRILCVVEGLILFRVAIQCREPRCILKEECDYFIYNVDRAYLQGIPNPSPASLPDDHVGVLPRGNLFTVAALVPTTSPSVFVLHYFHSEIGSWVSVEVSLKTPQKEFQVKIPKDACRFLSHTTSTVITLGGEGGTMGWVDLWRGILLCDVLSKDRELRGVPLPLPTAMFLPDGHTKIDFGCPRLYRGIAFIKEKRCLRFVDLDITCQRIPDPENESRTIDFRFDRWSISTWSNFKLTDSFDDWKMDFPPAHADTLELNEQMEKRLLDQLVRLKPPPQDNSVAAYPGQYLEKLWVFEPTPSMNMSNVVFLLAKARFLEHKSYVFAIDMQNRELQDVTEFGTERGPCPDMSRLHGSVSKYTKSNQLKGFGGELG